MSPAGPGAPAARTTGTEALAVVVTAGVTPYLRRTLRSVARQSVEPEAVIVIDVASRHNGLGDGTPVEEVVAASGIDARMRVRVVRAPDARGFGDAVARGLALYSELSGTGTRGPRASSDRPSGAANSKRSRGTTRRRGRVTDREGGNAGSSRASRGGRGWLWLLHDDAAPAPGCLEALLAAVAEARSAALVGPKQVDWDEPEHLLEVGLRTTASARRANDVVAGEIDQGQHDDRSDVLAVGTAGALIDRAVWEELDGTSPEFPVFNDGLELSRAVRLAGHRVVVVPQAVIRHRRASYLGLRPSQGGAPERPAADADPLPSAPWARAADPDPDRSFRARRIAQLTAWATFSGRPIGLLLIWFLILGIARSGVRLLTKSPALARAELGAALTVLRRGGAIRRGRRRLASHATVRRSVLTRLYVHAADIRSVRRDRRRQERERAVRAAAPSELELRELAVLARRRRLSLTGVLLAVVVVAGAGLSPLLVTGSITGGASVGLATTGRALWGAAWATWAASGDGYTAVANPLLALLALPVAVASRFGLDGDGLIRLLILAAVPLAALGAWFAAGTITRRVGLRAWAALTWALAPALLLAVGQGRLTAVLVHLALPWALLALARAVGADRRDAVLSGLVDAHHATEREKADLDRFASERVEDLAALADDSDDAAQSDGTGPDNEVAEADEGADEGDGPASSATDAAATAATEGTADSAAPRERAVALAATTERYGPGSPTAAAVAGILLTLVVAAAPSTAVVVLGCLLVLMAVVRHSALRLVLTLLPVAATAAPAWWHAGRLISAEGIASGLRYLLTDAGGPVAVPAPSPLDALLGLPVGMTALVTDPAVALVAGALLAILPAVALCGLVAGGRRGHRARAGLLGALGGLGLALLAVRSITAVGTLPDGTGSVTVTGWAGTGITLATAGLLAAGLAGADAAGASLVRRAGGWRHLVLAAVTIVGLVVPLTVGVSWALAARNSTGLGADATIMALRPGAQQVPVIARETQRSASAGRVLALTSTPEGMIVRTWRGAGTQLTDVVPDVLAAQLRDRLAEATGSTASTDSADSVDPVDPVDPVDTALVSAIASHPSGTTLRMAPADPADAELADIVTRATTGQDESAADDLAAHGIAVVLLTDAPGDETTALARAGLESTPGLDQLAQTAAGNSWRVSPSGTAESSRVTLLTADGAQEALPTSAGAGIGVTADIPDSPEGRARTLVLAERADAGWYATLNDEPLEAVGLQDATGGWRQAFAVPQGGGELVVSHRTTAGTVSARLIWATWAITALAALPLRRRRTVA